jgi:cytochrome c biogenesis protein CcmG/thiol:disulfide interchange protein DsbE
LNSTRSNWATIGAGLLIGVGLGIFLLAVFGVGRNYIQAKMDAGQFLVSGPAVDKPVLDFTLATLNGDQLDTNDLRGHPILINFWATWCGPCQVEMPYIEEAYEKFGPDLVVLAVNADEPADKVQAFVSDLGLKFNILLDTGSKVQELYRVTAFPTTYLIDRDGVVRVQHIGTLSRSQLFTYLQQVGLVE